ncbi:MAG: hypothetical protein FH748_06610 [Balneolaceae bacterium]|nr:hypothetical protein [Balneolaceae bacterium]
MGNQILTLDNTRMRWLFFVLALVWVTGCGNSEDSPTDPGGNNSFSHKKAPGTSAAELLASNAYSSLLIEVDYVQGYKPEQEALDNLKTFLQQRLYKPDGISITLDDEFPLTNDGFITATEAASLEDAHRDHFTTGDQLVVHLLVLDGRFEEENVLGIAYWNTSIALFSDLIEENSGGFGQPAEATVESTVLQHEMGHLLGLVDNGTPALTDHVDEPNGAHCTNDNCLMYYAVRNAGFISNLSGGSIPEIGEFCLEDLSNNGGK